MPFFNCTGHPREGLTPATRAAKNLAAQQLHRLTYASGSAWPMPLNKNFNGIAHTTPSAT